MACTSLMHMSGPEFLECAQKAPLTWRRDNVFPRRSERIPCRVTVPLVRRLGRKNENKAQASARRGEPYTQIIVIILSQFRLWSNQLYCSNLRTPQYRYDERLAMRWNMLMWRIRKNKNDDWSDQVFPSTHDGVIVFLFFPNPRAKYFLQVQ